MSDGVEVMKGLPRAPDVNYPVLVPNLKGYGIAVRLHYSTTCNNYVTIILI